MYLVRSTSDTLSRAAQAKEDQLKRSLLTTIKMFESKIKEETTSIRTETQQNFTT